MRHTVEWLLAAPAGAQAEISPPERSGFRILRGSIIFDAVAAVASAWLALAAIEHSSIANAVLASLAAGPVIFAAELWLVRSLPTDRPRPPDEVRWLLLLSALLAALMSWPFVLQAFQHDIDGQVAVIRNQRLTAFLTAQQVSPTGQLVTAWSSDVKNLQALRSLGGDAVNPDSDPIIQSLTKQRETALKLEQRYHKQFLCQLYGGANCSPKGEGPEAQASLASYEQSAHRVAQLNDEISNRFRHISGNRKASGTVSYDQVVTELNNALQQLRTAAGKEQNQTTAFKTRNNADNGIAINSEALLQLSISDLQLGTASALTLISLTVIFSLPVLIGLTPPVSNYLSLTRTHAGQEKGPAEETGQDGREHDMTDAMEPEIQGHAFISYVHEDSPEIKRLARNLENAGVRVWLDTKKLEPGQDWPTEIRRAITEDALAFIACFSERSLSRTTTYQNEELIIAIEQLRIRNPRDSWLIPVRLSDCEIPDLSIGAGRTLRNLQRVDLFGEQADENTARLVIAVLHILERTRG